MYHFFFGKNRSKILISLATYAYCQVPSIFVQWFRKKDENITETMQTNSDQKSTLRLSVQKN